ncbi:FAD dependent oxidoreductase [Plectosphaerella plurivora]|uniref:FAD dependent oxidoreductase n=1 Tax=Plectosphaerella plurivora TaxID=936078 RepID=A0A9P8VMC5_9PEZI|nr:FAD dependent oxidoreductase [Plectosphaerella plurivora]
MTASSLRDGQADLPPPRSTASFWHRDPSPLLGHRTTPDLPASTDTIIIGTGITGSFAAKFLKDKSPSTRVVLLDAREVCWGATGRNGGHCQPNVYAQAPAVSRFEVATFRYLRDLVAANAIPCDWVPLEGVHAYETKDLFAQATAHLVDRQRSDPELGAGARLAEKPEDLAALHVPSAAGAVAQTHAASVWPYKLVCWVIEDLLRRFSADGSFNLQTTTPVTHLQRLEYSIPSSSARWIAHTPRGQIAARNIILATNAHTSHLLPDFSDLIVPVRGQVAALLPHPGHASIASTNSYVFMGTPPSPRPSQDDYLIQRPDGARELILGGGRSRGTARGVGISSDDVIDPVVAEYLRATLARDLDLGPGGGPPAPFEAAYEWTGTMGFSRDFNPWVGAVPEGLGGGDGLWMSAAYTGHGMPQAALCGEAVVDMMFGGDGAIAADGFIEGFPLPDEFRITQARVHAARERESVREMDAMDMFI